TNSTPPASFILTAISLIVVEVISSDEPSGKSSETINSLWSSGGIQSRPIRALSGKMVAKTARQAIIKTTLCASDHSSILPYKRSIQRKNLDSFELWSDPLAFSSLALSIGVRVNETSIETMIEKAIVHPNW